MALTGSPRVENFPEILLQMFSFLPLKSLITGRTVSQEWRRLIPLANINPIRRSFLDFYFTLINSPIFPQTRPWVLANLQPFDRQQYINDLMDQPQWKKLAVIDQHPYIPEDFRMWILEWPAKAVIGCVWPGLPNVYCQSEAADNVHRNEGNNMLAPLPPTICALPYENYSPDAHFIPALSVFYGRSDIVWLKLDERDSLRDKVYILYNAARSFDGDPGWYIDDNWVDHQKRMWFDIHTSWTKRRAKGNLPILRLEDMPPPHAKYVESPMFTKSFLRGQLQAHTWRERDEPSRLVFRRGSFYTSGMNYIFSQSVVLQDDNHMPDSGERINYW
ncbi:hypothetical protein K443DRAFT_112052 [Laccaria amethystina LaAM-08-1]|uniref:F-box domain-containing protein n=1 Tax=Laccaria amethystina LaAM-08-1 TaxID=1095629 RepID=A0A0C9WIS5_9AGAR|nr:hypothetical protein K443DRAFT_112052 [Laccaria amethystina LaAM-08-1]